MDLGYFPDASFAFGAVCFLSGILAVNDCDAGYLLSDPEKKIVCTDWDVRKITGLPHASCVRMPAKVYLFSGFAWKAETSGGCLLTGK